MPATEVEQIAALGPGRLLQRGCGPPVCQRQADVSNLGDLLLYSLDDLEEIAANKGGIRQLLDEKWRKVYKATTPRGVFTTSEIRAA